MGTTQYMNVITPVTINNLVLLVGLSLFAIRMKHAQLSVNQT
jgi:hypothetical protein